MENNKTDIIISEIKKALKNIHESSDSLDKQVLLSKINSILDIEPDNLDVLCAKAIFFLKTNDPANALEACRQIQKIDSKNLVAKTISGHFDNNRIVMQRKAQSKAIVTEHERNTLNDISFFHLFIIKLIVLLLTLVFCFDFYFLSEKDRRILKLSAIENKTNAVNAQKFIPVALNQTSDFKYLSKKQIYDIRKKYVKNSLFAKNDYEPSNEVFGSIEDNKPWWSDISCNSEVYDNNYNLNIDGKSRISALINNPNLLVGITSPFIPNFNYGIKDFCTSKYSKFNPVSLEFDKKDNLFIASYNVKQDFINMSLSLDGKKTRYPLQLSGLNARDFGYNYVYAFDLKNIQMYRQDSISREIKTFDDYLHTGNSCKIEGGCNNISPTQWNKIFTLTGLPAEINLKLWKKRPKSKYRKADMYYKIIFNQE
ncbi:MAG: hypothetical protein LUE64_00810 [Candidatus Gastranaerophilales bacterium]|nr:hypothetical protein [Candidatus Gastranaerophilales bacterium]